MANACNHTVPVTAVQIETRAAGDGVELRVVDHGPGVPASDHDRIFEPFQRLDDTQSDGGSGLGLAVARGFLDAMNIGLRLAETPGGGLTVILTLSAADRTGPRRPAPSQPTHHQAIAR